MRIFTIATALALTIQACIPDKENKLFVETRDEKLIHAVEYGAQLWDIEILDHPEPGVTRVMIKDLPEPELGRASAVVLIDPEVLIRNQICIDNILAHEIGHIKDYEGYNMNDQFHHHEEGLMRPSINWAKCEASHIAITDNDVKIVFDK